MSPAATARILSFAVQRQKMPEWCWAAMSVSVDLFFRPDCTHTQCQLASAAFNRSCCDNSNPADAQNCNQPNTLHTVLETLHLLAADPVRRPDTPLSFDAVRKEIDGGRPICLLIRWLDKQGETTTRGHFIAIHGYRVTAGNKQFVTIGDPFYGASEIDFSQLSSAEGGYHDGTGLWFATFLVGNEAIR